MKPSSHLYSPQQRTGSIREMFRWKPSQFLDEEKHQVGKGLNNLGIKNPLLGES